VKFLVYYYLYRKKRHILALRYNLLGSNNTYFGIAV